MFSSHETLPLICMPKNVSSPTFLKIIEFMQLSFDQTDAVTREKLSRIYGIFLPQTYLPTTEAQKVIPKRISIENLKLAILLGLSVDEFIIIRFLYRIRYKSGKQCMGIHLMLFSLVGDAPQSPKFEEFHSSSCVRFYRAEVILAKHNKLVAVLAIRRFHTF